MSDHAKLSASSAHRWMVCHAAPRLEEGIPNQTSEHAQEGTNAHDHAEKILKGNLALEDTEYEIEPYIQYVRELAATGDLFIEQRLQYTDWVEDGFGTADAVIMDKTSHTMHIVDLKYGKGIRVDAENNPQLRLYALGALQKWMFEYEPDRVITHIVQPRLDHVSTEEIEVSELFKWGVDVLTEAQKTLDPTAKPNPGEKQCQWCKAKATCRERAIYSLQLKDTDKLSPDEVASLLPFASQVEQWAKDLKAHALHDAQNGTRFPGFKLVEGRSQRRYGANAEELVEFAVSHGIVKDSDQLYDKKLIGITAMTKLFGKDYRDQIDNYTVKPPGSLTLVPTTDKRPEKMPAIVEFPKGD